MLHPQFLSDLGSTLKVCLAQIMPLLFGRKLLVNGQSFQLIIQMPAQYNRTNADPISLKIKRYFLFVWCSSKWCSPDLQIWQPQSKGTSFWCVPGILQGFRREGSSLLNLILEYLEFEAEVLFRPPVRNGMD